MTAFCTATLHMDADLRPEDGILRAASLAVTADAHRAAERIIERAQREAERQRADAEETARTITAEAEQKTLQRADELLRLLNQAQADLLLRAQDLIMDVARGVFERLVMDMPPEERVAVVLRRLQHEAPARLIEAQLRVHPGDLDCVPTLDWEVKPDASVPSGTCILEAANGEWTADFGAAVAALQAAFSDVARGGQSGGMHAERSPDINEPG